MRRTKREWYEEDNGGYASAGTDASCDTCRDKNPHIRYVHYLAIAKMDGAEGIKKHLENATSFKEHIRTGIVEWVKDQMELWAGLADKATGRAIPWYEARQLAMQSLQHLGPVKDDAPKLGDMVTALRQAEQAQQTSRDRAWVAGHNEMVRQGLNLSGREKDAAVFCREMAVKHPQDAAEWEREAETYELMTGEKPTWMVFEPEDDNEIPF